VAVRDRVGGAGLDAIAAEDAARVVDIVDARVAFAGRYAICCSVFGGLDVNAIRGARSGTQKTAYAFFEAVLVAMQDVNTAITRLKLNRSIRINLGRGFAKHRLQRHAEALHKGRKCCADFSDDRSHMIESSRDRKAQQLHESYGGEIVSLQPTILRSDSTRLSR
jgi:hypothetical protein